jgi:hypothetical protein
MSGIVATVSRHKALAWRESNEDTRVLRLHAYKKIASQVPTNRSLRSQVGEWE